MSQPRLIWCVEYILHHMLKWASHVVKKKDICFSTFHSCLWDKCKIWTNHFDDPLPYFLNSNSVPEMYLWIQACFLTVASFPSSGQFRQAPWERMPIMLYFPRACDILLHGFFHWILHTNRGTEGGGGCCCNSRFKSRILRDCCVSVRQHL
jgi:hypothetical protein